MKKISRKTIARVFLYIRTLDGLIREKKHIVSSSELARITGLSDVNIRKDISNFGKVGTPRVGYNILELKNMLEDFVLQDNIVHVVLFGVGNLGAAILKYPAFQRDKIKIVAAFDSDPGKIEQKINGVLVYAPGKVAFVIKKTNASIGIIAVPKEKAQEVADIAIRSGLKGIINFAPTSINVPKKVIVKDIDLTIELLSLFHDSHM